MTCLRHVFIVSFILLVTNSTNGLLSVRKHIIDPPESVTLRNTRTTSNLYFEQKIDNFNHADTRTWKQRYHLSEDYYNETSKNHVFLLLGGEWEAIDTWLNYGSWIDTAKQYGALLIYLEHRYYGISQPFSDLSTENLQYLSIHQALEDTANFIEGINNIYNLTSDVKWIVFGGSYAGTMAAWMRHKYPHLVTGAMSSSAPLKAILDFHEYLQVVRNSLATHSIACVDNIKEAFAELEELVASCLEDVEIYQELDEMFQLCDSIELSEGNEKDLSTLFEVLTDDIFAYVTQYNGRLQVSIDDLCEIMVNDTEGYSMLQRLGQVNSLMLNTTSTNCTDFKYTNFLGKLQNTTIKASSMMRQWVYQTCTEFGFFQTSSQEVPIFGSRFDVSFFTDLCVDLFGENFNETLTNMGIHATNTRYGATNIATSNIVYFHGAIDPWHPLGKLETSDDINDSVIIVEDASHCMNMQPSKETDSEALQEARKSIDKLIGQWLTSTSANDDDTDDSNDDDNKDNDGTDDSNDDTNSSNRITGNIIFTLSTFFLFLIYLIA
ncbi:putative serine protease K12H4.7 [Anthonomus grandis grandis]|uniref:putative serine protease K12H4.7 n=1 Tax=Anthonomus grandis grandis TaxID=2921223 RepID=UPI002165A4E3|nr:putative serine protease K12H4.7 [Anthonomus grandis grandis]